MIHFYSSNYTAQCTPIAILNALRFIGEQLTPISKQYKRILKMLDYNISTGTPACNIAPVLKKIGFKIEEKNNITLYDLSKYLKKGYLVIFSYISFNKNGHTVLIINQTKRFFIVINEISAESLVSRKSKKYYARCYKNSEELDTLKGKVKRHAVILKKYKQKIIQAPLSREK